MPLLAVEVKDPRKIGHHDPFEKHAKDKKEIYRDARRTTKNLRKHLSRDRHDRYDKRRLEEDIAFPDPSSDDDDEDNVSASAQDFGSP